jgi:hypothetical protein
MSALDDAIGETVRTAVESAVTDALAGLERRLVRPRLVSQEVLAHELGVSPRTVYALRQEGLPTVLVGESPRFEVDVVIGWLKARGE